MSMHTDRFQYHLDSQLRIFSLDVIILTITFPWWCTKQYPDWYITILIVILFGWLLDSTCDDLLNPTDWQSDLGVGSHESHRVIGGPGERDAGRTENNTTITKLLTCNSNGNGNGNCSNCTSSEFGASPIVFHCQCASACIGSRSSVDYHPQPWGGSATSSSLAWTCNDSDRKPQSPGHRSSQRLQSG